MSVIWSMFDCFCHCTFHFYSDGCSQ